jgi:hypothetical protein
MGASLYDGLNPNATGASDMQFVAEFVAAQQQEDAARAMPPPGTFEERLDARLRDAAVRWVAKHPWPAMRLGVVKFFRMWSPLPNAEEFQSWTFRLVVFLSYAPLMLAALWGAWREVPRSWAYALCVVPAAYLTLLHVVFVSSIRYREPAMLPLIVLAVGAWLRGQVEPGGKDQTE